MAVSVPLHRASDALPWRRRGHRRGRAPPAIGRCAYRRRRRFCPRRQHNRPPAAKRPGASAWAAAGMSGRLRAFREKWKRPAISASQPTKPAAMSKSWQGSVRRVPSMGCRRPSAPRETRTVSTAQTWPFSPARTRSTVSRTGADPCPARRLPPSGRSPCAKRAAIRARGCFLSAARAGRAAFPVA